MKKIFVLLLLVSTFLFLPALVYAQHWTTTTSMSRPRYSHTSTLLPNGKVLVVGNDDRTLSGTERAACFRREAGLTQASLVSQRDKQKLIANYISILLYELQERVENAYDNGKISSEDAAEMIDLITEAKHRLMNAQSKESVRETWQAIKDKWLEVKLE